MFALAMPVTGLLLNLKFPSLKWTNEQVPIKQGKAVLFTILMTFAIGLGYIVLGLVTPIWTIALLLGVVAVCTVIMLEYIFNKVDLAKID